MKETEHRIVISHAARKELEKEFKAPTIRAALTFRRNSLQSEMIRLKALEDYGGKEVWV